MIKNYRNVATPISFYGQSPNSVSGGPSFSPLDIAGLAAWFKADSLTLSDGDAVSTWNDSSGNSRDATGGGGSADPIYKTNVINGLPVVRFDGGDFLTHPTLTNSGSSIFFVISGSSSMTGNDGIYSWTDGGDDYAGGNTLTYGTGYAGGPPSGFGGIWRGIGTWFTNITTAFEAFFSYSVIVSDAGSGDITMTIRKSETTLETKTAAGLLSNSMQNCFIGARGTGASAANPKYIGDFAELIIYNLDIGTTDRDKVELYLKTKYNL